MYYNVLNKFVNVDGNESVLDKGKMEQNNCTANGYHLALFKNDDNRQYTYCR